jgi:hypothetical protein
MLHSKVYNKGLSHTLRDAYARRDSNFLEQQIQILADTVAALTPGDEEYDIMLSKLQIHLALRDSIKSGQTNSLLMDFINL